MKKISVVVLIVVSLVFLCDLNKVYAEATELDKNAYITVEDLKPYTDNIKNNQDTNFEVIKDNITLRKNESLLIAKDFVIAEKGELTNNAYQSIISILEVMFDTDEVCSYFKHYYPSFSKGNSKFRGFEIEINPLNVEWDGINQEEFRIVKVKIDKYDITEAVELWKEEKNSVETKTTETISKDVSTNEQKKNENEEVLSEKTDNKQEETSGMPKTGKEENPILIYSYVFITLASIGIVFLIITRKNN